MFLLEKKPFTNYSIQVYANASESPKKNQISKTPKIGQQKIATPSLKSRFISPKLKKKTLAQNKNKGFSGNTNILQLYSGVDNQKVNIEKKEKEKKKNKIDDKENRKSKNYIKRRSK